MFRLYRGKSVSRSHLPQEIFKVACCIEHGLGSLLAQIKTNQGIDHFLDRFLNPVLSQKLLHSHHEEIKKFAERSKKHEPRITQGLLFREMIAYLFRCTFQVFINQIKVGKEDPSRRGHVRHDFLETFLTSLSDFLPVIGLHDQEQIEIKANDIVMLAADSPSVRNRVHKP